MSKREALRELQSRLAERMQEARTQPRTAAWLAIECRNEGLLFPLQQAGEIFPVVPLVAVPHTQPWFAGVANLRGSLYGVVDLGRFLGMPGAALEGARDQARVVVFNAALGLNCALLVDRLAGLRSAEHLQAEPVEQTGRPPFAGMRYRDGQGRVWQEVLLTALAADERFLGIAG